MMHLLIQWETHDLEPTASEPIVAIRALEMRISIPEWGSVRRQSRHSSLLRGGNGLAPLQ